MATRDHQSPTSWSSGESLTWINAVEGYSKEELGKRLFLELKAIESTNIAEFESLIVRGASLDVRDEYQQTLEEVAIQKGRVEVLAIIKKWRKAGRKGATVQATANWGETDPI